MDLNPLLVFLDIIVCNTSIKKKKLGSICNEYGCRVFIPRNFKFIISYQSKGSAFFHDKVVFVGLIVWVDSTTEAKTTFTNGGKVGDFV